MGIVENLDPLLRHVGLRVDRQNVTPDTAAILLLAGFGAISIGSFFYKLLRILVNVYLVPGIPLSKFGASKKAPGSGSWAVVTGATDGIGKEFALQLAKAGFNVLLASRTPEKLGAVAGEIESKYPGVKTKSQAIDFALGDEKQYLALEDALKGLDVGVLVNNVGKSHDIPVTFAEVSAQEMEDIVEINIVAQLRVTKMVVNGMIER
ncbi:NAD(P)-binding protein, partial [Violaceomyces palustris]